MHGHGHRNHLRLAPRHAHDAVLAVLHERADRLGRVDDLERIHRRRQRGQHRGLRHRQVHFAKLQQRMSAGEQALRIDVGHGAGGGNIHIATNQHGADGGSRFDRFRLLAIARRANAHHRNDARRGELRSVALQGLVRKTVEHERRFDGLQIVAVILGRERRAFAGARGLRGCVLLRGIVVRGLASDSWRASAPDLLPDLLPDYDPAH